MTAPGPAHSTQPTKRPQMVLNPKSHDVRTSHRASNKWRASTAVASKLLFAYRGCRAAQTPHLPTCGWTACLDLLASQARGTEPHRAPPTRPGTLSQHKAQAALGQPCSEEVRSFSAWPSVSGGHARSWGQRCWGPMSASTPGPQTAQSTCAPG